MLAGLARCAVFERRLIDVCAQNSRAFAREGERGGAADA
jgi:hypothetical protein